MRGIHSGGVYDLAAAPLANLTRLDLENQHLGLGSISLFGNDHLGRLRHLGLAGTGVDSYLHFLTSSPRRRFELESLDLHRVFVTPADVDSMVRFIDQVDHPAVRANIDVSHLQLARVAPEELRRLKGKAIHVHISDCDGQVHGDLPPGRGVVDFAPYLREIKNLGIDGAVSIELEYSPEPDKIADWVKEAYTATDRLMKEANLRG